MNKKPERKKLRLNKQTIRQLTSTELETAVGGQKVRVTNHSFESDCCGSNADTCTTGC